MDCLIKLQFPDNMGTDIEIAFSAELPLEAPEDLWAGAAGGGTGADTPDG